MIVCRDLNELPPFKKSVVTIGSFDGVHQGHRKLLQKISEIAAIENLISIVITFDPHPRQVIYPKDTELKLLNNLDEKLEAMGKSNIDYVVIVPFTVEFSQISPLEYIENFLVEQFNPAHIVIGYDHKFGLNRQGDIHLLKKVGPQYGFEITELSAFLLNDIAVSSTKIRNALLEGDIALSSMYLEDSYPISGIVTKGQQLGRKIGYPTANIKVESPHKLIPAYGVYAVTVRLDNDHLHNGMLYIGTKPTLKGSEEEVIEVNIFDFSQDIYGKDIRVYLHAYVRDDIKFNSIEELTSQLAKDETIVREILKVRQENQRPEVALVILNYNGEDYLESFLPYMTDSYTNGSSKIYVVDNKSTDNSLNYIREWHPEVEIIELDKNYGFAEGYNKGLAQIESTYYALVNSDLQVTDYWLDPIITLMKTDDKIAAVQPKIMSS